ncbi:MAG: TonB-dependent receptor, partial [Chitinophagia bacterium]|nr:TonB-dependent receptor [Chitinophagia bacterium]
MKKLLYYTCLLLIASFATAQKNADEKSIYVSGNTDSNSVKAKLMPSIEIQGVRAGQNYPFTQTMIYKSAISKNNVGQDIPFIMNQVPGAVIHSDAGNGVGYTGIRIRGTDASRINFTINGIAYNDAESQGVF